MIEHTGERFFISTVVVLDIKAQEKIEMKKNILEQLMLIKN